MSSSSNSNGISVVGLLGVVFVVLKLCHVIDWSWWLVTLPFWGGLAIFLSMLAFGGVALGIGAIVVAICERISK